MFSSVRLGLSHISPCSWWTSSPAPPQPVCCTSSSVLSSPRTRYSVDSTTLIRYVLPSYTIFSRLYYIDQVCLPPTRCLVDSTTSIRYVLPPYTMFGGLYYIDQVCLTPVHDVWWTLLHRSGMSYPRTRCLVDSTTSIRYVFPPYTIFSRLYYIDQVCLPPVHDIQWTLLHQ